MRIIFANYGRTDSTTCTPGQTGSQAPENSINNLNCIHEVTSILQSKCDNKKSCTFHASNDAFTDPCVGTYKYLGI